MNIISSKWNFEFHENFVMKLRAKLSISQPRENGEKTKYKIFGKIVLASF